MSDSPDPYKAPTAPVARRENRQPLGAGAYVLEALIVLMGRSRAATYAFGIATLLYIPALLYLTPYFSITGAVISLYGCAYSLWRRRELAT